MKAYFSAPEGAEMPAPIDEMGAYIQAAPLEGGVAEVVTLDLEPGRYAFYCFFADRAGGPPHFALGMLQEVTVR